MNEFFGIDMTYIMIALLVLLAIALGSVGWVVATNRVMFNVGVRNIPRRRAQTLLIIIGLMLSTVIISAAFAIGDTADYSISNQAYERLNNFDIAVQATTGDDGAGDDPFDDNQSIISALAIPESQADDLLPKIRATQGVDGAIKVIRAPAAAQNTGSGQAEPIVIIIGVDASDLSGFESDFVTLDGVEVSPAELGDDEIYMNASAADALDTEAGDIITIFANGEATDFRVRAIVKDRVLTGAVAGITQGFLLPLDRVQQMYDRPGEVDLIAVSNEGGVRGGLALSADVAARLDRDSADDPDEYDDVLAGTNLGVNETKRIFVDDAAAVSSFIVTFFVMLGLFSIAAGMLLVFLIFVMLAAERKVEMGMMRAVGTKRSHLVQSFMSEGMVYNVGAALVGVVVGVLVSVVIIQVMARLFEQFDLGITFNVTARSLIVSYSIGVVLTFLTVTFSSWRIGNLNIVSAIRDIADPVTRPERPSFSRGLAGVLSFIVWLLFTAPSWRNWLVAGGIIVLGGAMLALAVVLFIGAGALYGASLIGGVLGVLLAILGGFAAVAGAGLILYALNSVLNHGPIMLLASGPLIALGFAQGSAFPAGVGLSLLIIGAALTIRYIGAPARPVFTTMGLTMLFFWLLFAGGNIPGTQDLEGDIEMFFLSGVTMVIAATFVLVYNADLLLGLFEWLGRASSRLVPAIRTAVAYPLANKFRTGMTIAMISMVMFALVMISTMNANFDRIFLSQDALGGYDIAVSENPGNPLAPGGQASGEALTGTLQAEGFNTNVIDGVDPLESANSSVSTAWQMQVLGPDEEREYKSVSIIAASDAFLANSDLTLQSRANGFDSDEAVFEAMRTNDDYVVIDAFSVASGGFGPSGFAVENIEPADKTFDPIEISIRDESTRKTRNVQLIGVLSTEVSGLYNGMFITRGAFDDVYQQVERTTYMVRVAGGVDSDATAKEIEATLLSRGVQADDLRGLIEEFQAQQRGFLYLIQGFMAIGLFVGIAAVGVIAFRTVVERRQQIGMLRAIGYSRRQVALSFIMESSFTALLGIGSGIALALLLAYQLVNTDDFVPGGVDSFYIPWLQIIAVGGFAFLASLVMTLIPSRQASSIPIAEALRYE
jgi:putative ABC transport system permease protein